MRKLFLILAILFISACQDDKDSGPQMGCTTGIPKGGSTDRVFIRCCTHAEFLAGNNVNNGGTSQWTNYTGHQWTAVSDCSNCK